MSITVDTVQLRFHIKPDYDQQQIQQLQSDLKQYTNGPFCVRHLLPHHHYRRSQREKRWILTHGIWDDGAAWLDDGRWNDGSNGE